MRDTTALSTPFVISSMHTTRPPMSEARRQHVYGKLVGLAEEAREAGEPSHIGGVLWLGLILSILAFAWVIS